MFTNFSKKNAKIFLTATICSSKKILQINWKFYFPERTNFTSFGDFPLILLSVFVERNREHSVDWRQERSPNCHGSRRSGPAQELSRGNLPNDYGWHPIGFVYIVRAWDSNIRKHFIKCFHCALGIVSCALCTCIECVLCSVLLA